MIFPKILKKNNFVSEKAVSLSEGMVPSGRTLGPAGIGFVSEQKVEAHFEDREKKVRFSGFLPARTRLMH